MFAKVSFVAAASVAAIAVSRIKISSPTKPNPPIKPAENDGSISSQQDEIEEEEEEKYSDSEFSVPSSSCVLQNVVKEMERKRVALEGKLIEMYSIKEQRLCIAQLEKQLKVKTAEAGVLSITVNSLTAERKKLLEEVKEGALVEKQLKIAKKKVKELEEKVSVDRGWARKTLLTLAEEVPGFEKSGICGIDLDNVGKMIRNVELTAMEMRRRNKELEMERRGLRIMLASAEDKVTTQIEVKDKLEEEMNNFRQANESLSKQIENLQKKRLAIFEELMYQRSLNTCLRFERQNFVNPSQEFHANNKSTPTPIPDLVNSYSKSSTTSSIDTTTIDSSSSSQGSISKKYHLIHNIRRWGRRKGNSRFGVSSSERCYRENSPVKAGGLIRRLSMSDVPLKMNEDDRKIKRVWVRSIGEVDDKKNTAMKSSSRDSIMGGVEKHEESLKKGSLYRDLSGTEMGNGKVQSGDAEELRYSKMLPEVLRGDSRVWTPVLNFIAAFFLFIFMLPVYMILLNAGFY